MLEEWDVLMPELAGMDKIPHPVAEIQRYTARDGKMLWRSLDRKRSVFRSGYESRERCAQEVVRDCKNVAEAIGWRRSRLARDKS